MSAFLVRFTCILSIILSLSSLCTICSLLSDPLPYLQETKRCVLLYAGVDTSSPAGMKLREQLDEIQLTIIKSLLGTTINVL